MQQDPIEYNSVTWHTNLDTYERAVPEDLKQAATVIAAEVWHLANRDQPMPRFTKDDFPPPTAATPAAPAPAAAAPPPPAGGRY